MMVSSFFLLDRNDYIFHSQRTFFWENILVTLSFFSGYSCYTNIFLIRNIFSGNSCLTKNVFFNFNLKNLFFSGNSFLIKNDFFMGMTRFKKNDFVIR